MSTHDEGTFEVSFPKALLVSGISMTSFLIACYAIGMPMHDPLLVGFLVVVVVVMTPAFAACFVFMLRCKIDHTGLRPAVPGFYQRVLRWSDVATVRKDKVSPFYVVRGSDLFGEFCVLPRPFLLKRPESLRQLIEQYAPTDNIVRRRLAV